MDPLASLIEQRRQQQAKLEQYIQNLEAELEASRKALFAVKVKLEAYEEVVMELQKQGAQS